LTLGIEFETLGHGEAVRKDPPHGKTARTRRVAVLLDLMVHQPGRSHVAWRRLPLGRQQIDATGGLEAQADRLAVGTQCPTTCHEVIVEA
jgi:hypothetical protein